jgi:hypothetical protein
LNQDPRLERYLSKLEGALKSFPVSDRAEIITEIKSHVLSALERDPNIQLDTILAALGEPETVANRYLLERGLNPAKPPISPIVKWVVIGFLGTLALLLIFAGLVVSTLSPIVQVDGKTDNVTLLGGLVRVDGANEEVIIAGKSLTDIADTSHGSSPVNKGQSITVRFSTGRIDIRSANDNRLSWDCQGLGPEKVKTRSQAQTLVLDLTTYFAAKCEIHIPENIDLSMTGGNAEVAIDQPRFNIDASFGNANVRLNPDPGHKYLYDLKVDRGSVDGFTSSNDPKSYKIKIAVDNGKITAEAPEEE